MMVLAPRSSGLGSVRAVVLGDQDDIVGLLRGEGVDEPDDRQQEDHECTEEEHRGRLSGTLSEDAEAVGGEQQAAKGLAGLQGAAQPLGGVERGVPVSCAGMRPRPERSLVPVIWRKMP